MPKTIAIPEAAIVSDAEGAFEQALVAVRACRLCAADLPLGPRPVVHVKPEARLLIMSQAPGTAVHETGLSFNDRSGDRLREWLGITREEFYGNRHLGIMGMGFCYPGVDANGGDKPPMKICAPTWHPQLRPLMPKVELSLLVGHYAQVYYLGQSRKESMTATVRAWREYLPEFLPLPHPSWRNTAWLRKNPWFARDILPDLRRRVRRLLATG
jgi:uracil-DNA glycosylase